MEGWDLVVIEFEGSAEALDYLSTTEGGEKTDIVLLDVKMPHRNGLELAADIRTDPRFAHISIVMISSLGANDLDMENEDVKVDAWLSKPIRQLPLYHVLKSITVRKNISSDSSKDIQEETLLKHGGSAAKHRALLVEDNTVNQLVATEMLTKLGCDVAVANNGVEAVEQVKCSTFDIVFMDCQMPIMDGYEATREIRSWERENQHSEIPIVALTANALSSEKGRCRGVGMSDYASKPYKIESLQKMLEVNIESFAVSSGDSVNIQ